MFWNNSRTFYNLSKALGAFGFLPLRGAGTGFVVVLPLLLIFDPPLYILHFTIYTTFHREATLKTVLELLDYSVNNNTQVYQIHKEGGVAHRFLTARRHFWTPWSERTHCMENGQSVFFLSPHTTGEARALRARKILTPRVTDFFTDFEKKTDCFAVYKTVRRSSFNTRTRIRLSFAHHMTPALLRMLSFEWQAINLLLPKAISFFMVWSTTISGQ